MAKVNSQVRIVPYGNKGNASKVLYISWQDRDKRNMAVEAVKAVTLWARNKYIGDTVVVDKGTLRPGADGRGILTVNGKNVSYFVVVDVDELPAPVPALFAAGGR